uniref:Retrotransposon gag domain-containing protein n=1 Tax=Caenorhabditis japonica TaxID=281687 RepID=A0A8R1IMR7_CAEJA
MEHPAHLSCDAVTDRPSPTTLRRIQVRIEKLEKERATMAFADVLPRAELNTPPETHSVKRLADSDSGKLQNLTISKQPQGNSASPPGEQVNPGFSDKSDVSAPVSGKPRKIPAVDTKESMSEKKSGVTSNETPARVVAAMSQSCGKAPVGPQEDIIVASQSNVALEHNAQHPLINVITQSDRQQAAAAANKRGTTRSRSPNRRVTRAMSVSQHPRINVIAIKSASTVPIFSGTSNENFHAFVRNFKDHVRLISEPDDREVRNHLLTVLTDSARDTAEEVLDRNPEAESEDIIDAIRAQYEDQCSTQNRIDTIKSCFQYAEEPVQDYYQRIRKLMREAQTGVNRAEVIGVAKEAFRTGLQSDIGFFVTTARSTEFDQIYKDAVFFEKALQDKEKKDRADASAVLNRPHTAKVFAQAALQPQEQYYDYDNPPNQRFSLNRRINNVSDSNQLRTQTRFRDKKCWYCNGLAHYRNECRKMKADRKAGVYRSSIEAPFDQRYRHEI